MTNMLVDRRFVLDCIIFPDELLWIFTYKVVEKRKKAVGLLYRKGEMETV